jgi:hypothetical protein
LQLHLSRLTDWWSGCCWPPRRRSPSGGRRMRKMPYSRQDRYEHAQSDQCAGFSQGSTAQRSRRVSADRREVSTTGTAAVSAAAIPQLITVRNRENSVSCAVSGCAFA